MPHAHNVLFFSVPNETNYAIGQDTLNDGTFPSGEPIPRARTEIFE